jgi:hypothetical protein
MQRSQHLGLLAVSSLRCVAVLQVPDSLVNRVPRGFDLAAQRKGFKRYSSARLKDLVAGLAEAQAEVQGAASTILQVGGLEVLVGF